MTHSSSEAIKQKLLADFNAVMSEADQLLKLVTDEGGDKAYALRTKLERNLNAAKERLRGTSDTGEQMRESFQVVGAKLRRARELIRDRPGTASVLAGDVLRELDTVDAARQDTARMT